MKGIVTTGTCRNCGKDIERAGVLNGWVHKHCTDNFMGYRCSPMGKQVAPVALGVFVAIDTRVYEGKRCKVL